MNDRRLTKLATACTTAYADHDADPANAGAGRRYARARYTYDFAADTGRMPSRQDVEKNAQDPAPENRRAGA